MSRQILTLIRGDARTLTITASEDVSAAVSILFSAKSNKTLPDDQATVQKFLGSGLSVSTTTISTQFVRDDTKNLSACTLVWDVAAQWAGEEPRTVAEGILNITADVTREIDISIPVHTTDPDAVTSNAAAAAASAAAAANSAAATAALFATASITALAALTPAADKLAYFDFGTTAALTDFTSYARQFVACANAAAALTVLGTLSATAIAAADTAVATTAANALSAHAALTNNPHSVTKAQVGLSAVENTALSTWAGTANLTTLGTITSGATGAGFTVALGASTITGTLGVTNGGNGLATAALGDLRYGSGANTLAALAGNTSATLAVLTQTGNGSASAAPAWLTTTGTGSIVRAISPAFTGVPTAPTAAAGNNSTQLATTAYCDTAVANLVASSPSTLDTLNELATALGDDPNFATTVATNLGTKAPKGALTASGLTMTSARLLGRTTAATGAIEELTVGSSLTLSAGALDAIQDIRTSASPTLTGLTLSGLNTANGLVHTNGSGALSTTLTPSGLTSLGVASVIAPAALALNASGNVTINTTNGATLAATFSGANTTLAGILSVNGSDASGRLTVSGNGGASPQSVIFDTSRGAAAGAYGYFQVATGRMNIGGTSNASGTYAGLGDAIIIDLATKSIGIATSPNTSYGLTINSKIKSTDGTTATNTSTGELQLTGIGMGNGNIYTSGVGSFGGNLTVSGTGSFAGTLTASTITTPTATALTLTTLDSNSNIYINPNGTGNVGIGAASAPYRLYVTGAAADYVAKIFNSNSGGSGNGLLIDTNSVSGTNNFPLTVASNGTSYFQVREDGLVSALGVTEATTGGAGSLTTAGGFYAAMGIVGHTFVTITTQLRAAYSAAATTLGTVVKKLQVFDSAGTSLGFFPIYDAIT